MKRRFLRLIRIGDEACGQIDEEVRDTAMARVVNLGDVFQLIIHGFDVTVANSKIAPMPLQAGAEYPAIPEGKIQKGRSRGIQLDSVDAVRAGAAPMRPAPLPPPPRQAAL